MIISMTMYSVQFNSIYLAKTITNKKFNNKLSRGKVAQKTETRRFINYNNGLLCLSPSYKFNPIDLKAALWK
jgi:hypothetical protein